MYQVASSKAEEFIHDGEIVETLAYARENRANRPLIEAILQKAAEGKGVTHREAAVLLECELEDLNQRMFTLAKQIKENIYGNRIVMFAPLYLSNYCVNGCVYCPYHAEKQDHSRRKKLTQDEIRQRGDCPAGYGSQASGTRSRRGPAQQSDRVHSRIDQDHLLHHSTRTGRSAA